jgi:hypothetical protein
MMAALPDQPRVPPPYPKLTIIIEDEPDAFMS